MASKPKSIRVRQMTNGRATPNGALVQFEVHGTDNSVTVLEMATKNVGHLIGFLAGLAQHADKNKPEAQREAELAKGAHEGPVITPLQVGFAPGQTPQEAVLVCQTGEFSLGFSLSTSALPALEEALAHMLSSHPPAKPN